MHFQMHFLLYLFEMFISDALFFNNRLCFFVGDQSFVHFAALDYDVFHVFIFLNIKHLFLSSSKFRDEVQYMNCLVYLVSCFA